MVACSRLTPAPIIRKTMNRVCPVVLVLAIASAVACDRAGAPAAARGGDIPLVREAITVSATVGSGATLASILRAQGVAAAG